MMHSLWIAPLVACVAWWLSTGALLWAVKAADAPGGMTHGTVCALGAPLLPVGGYLIYASLGADTAAAHYAGFFGALAIWGWIELAFLTGVITGPSSQRRPATAHGMDRFWRAFATVAWHETALFAGLFLLFLAFDGAANVTGLLTYAILFAARVSAKLNLFLGVPRIHVDFLPRPLAHLPSHFNRAPFNNLLPFSVALLIGAVAWCVLQTLSQSSVGYALLAALASLALLEHLMMIVPLPDDKLWRWMIPTPKPDTNPSTLREDPNGL